MLRINHVSKRLQDFCLQDVNFHLPKGYIGGVFGPNGSGKTTLINLILGLYHADEGNILVDGKDILAEEKACKEQIGVVLNENLFPSGITLLENANMLGKYYKNYDIQLLKEYCDRFALSLDRKFGKLSKGENLKYQFAFALSHQPKLLLLDEPTANFEPEFRQEFLKIITEFVADGEKSILLATHILEDLQQVGDYFLFLEKGKVDFAMDRSELEDSYRMVQGENYKIKLLKPERVIHAEYGKDMGKALVCHSKFTEYDKEVTVTIPSLEEIMYFTVKSKKNKRVDKCVR